MVMFSNKFRAPFFDAFQDSKLIIFMKGSKKIYISINPSNTEDTYVQSTMTGEKMFF